MPIDSKHPVYQHFEESWIDCRDSFEGQRAVKAAGVRYLPRLAGQSEEEYQAYKMRALFYSITAKTLSAVIGMAIDQPPSLTYPDKLKPYFEDHSGTQFYEVLTNAVQEILL